MGGTEPGAAAPRPPWPGGAAWIDGRYCPVEEAKISVLDLGVTRSDCTYDVVHVWRGRFYRLDAHLDRFAASMVIDGQPVGTGAPGPLTLQLRDRYWASHDDPRYSTPVRYDEPS